VSAIADLAPWGDMGRNRGGVKASVGEMVGDFLREASVLVMVFGFLDILVGDEPPGRSLHDRFDGLPIDWIILVLAVSMSLLVVGVVLERIRR
jgi:hypothetical protein